MLWQILAVIKHMKYNFLYWPTDTYRYLNFSSNAQAWLIFITIHSYTIRNESMIPILVYKTVQYSVLNQNYENNVVLNT